MAATRFLDGEQAWARIREGVRKGRSHVAVAWWGSGMARLLPLKAGSVLVVRADRATMEQGQTNPYELEKLVQKGVRVFPLRNLHAKVFVFGKSAVIGSMNVSTNSWEGGILEAGVEVGGAAVNTARRQVLAWALDKALDLQDLKELKSHYRPPERGGGRRRRSPKNRSAPRLPVIDLPDLKILRTQEGRWEDHTQERFDADEPALAKEASRAGERIEGIEWTGTVPKADGHTRILEVITASDGTRWVQAPARLRLTTGTKRGKPEKLIYLTRTDGVKRRKLSLVAKALGPNTTLVRLLKDKGRQFKAPEDLVRLFGLWGVRR